MAQEAIRRAGADVEAPKKTHPVEPVYPEAARAQGVEGPVVVGFTVDVDGGVTDPVVLFGHALLADAALAAVRQWRFQPAREDGEAVSVRMVEAVPFSLSTGSRPAGWPKGSYEGPEHWITWPRREKPLLELVNLDSEELPPPSTLRVYRGTVKNVSKEPLQSVLAAAISRESLNGPQKTIGQNLGDLAPGDERAFELKPEGHQVDVVFGQVVEGDLQPVPVRRQIKTMLRVLPSRPITDDRISACLGPPPDRDSIMAGRARSQGDEDRPGTLDWDYDAPPKPLKITKPEYPKETFDAGVEGTVVVEILINSRGYVDCARLLKSLPGTGLDATALVTVYRWRFEPAVKGGVAVPTIAHAPVTFRIY